MARKWHESSIVKIKDESSTTKRFWLDISQQEEAFSFRAGQFITMDLPIGEKRRDRWRSYSIASSPSLKDQLELCIVELEGGRASTYLFKEAREGTTIRFKGPEGMFVLPEEIQHELVFICTGTGVAPFRSMIADLVENNKLTQPIHLIFGTRYAEGVLYQDEFAALARSNPNFKYSVTLSREKNIDDLNFDFPVYSGYVHQVYEQEYGQHRDDIRFYLCGWSNMIDEAIQRLTENLGYNKEQVIHELYG
ncbi:MAG: FAD-dependent oxidoreductase [Bacteroidota bacterium]